MTQVTDQPNTDIAKQALDQAGTATGQPAGAPAGGATGTEGAPAPAGEQYNAFQSEDAELARLEAEEAKAREQAAAGAAGTGGQPAAAATGQPAAGATGQPAASSGQPAAAADPAAQVKEAGDKVQAAFIALRKKNAELAANNLVLQGQVQALSGLARQDATAGGGTQDGNVQDAGSTTGTETTVDQQLESIDQQMNALAVKVDKGEIDMQEYTKQTTALRRQERELLVSAAEERAAARMSSTTSNNDLGLQEHVQKLVGDYPILNKLNRAQLEPYEALAYSIAAAQGNPIPEGPLGTKRLRETMAELAERDYDPQRYTARLQARAAAATGGAAPGAQPGAGAGTGSPSGQGQSGATGGAKPAGSQPTAAERAAKLQQAGSMPPDIGSMGAGATAGEISVEQGAATLSSFKNDDDALRWLDANPQFVQKVAGTSFRVTKR